MAILIANPGIQINMVDHLNRTPLHFAVQNKSTAAVRLILDHGDANLTIEDDSGRTPYALALELEAPEIAELVK